MSIQSSVDSCTRQVLGAGGHHLLEVPGHTRSTVELATVVGNRLAERCSRARYGLLPARIAPRHCCHAYA